MAQESSNLGIFGEAAEMDWRGLVIVGLICVAVLVAGALGCSQTAAPGGSEAEIALPPPHTESDFSVEEALAQRRSIRQFTREELTVQEIGQLSWAAQGITKPETGFRTAPSAGATYPLELYLFTEDGVFHYVPDGHKLVGVSGTDERRALAAAALGQPWVAEAPLDFVITAVCERTSGKYGDRAERYVHMEAGHVAENIHLQAVALGLGSVPVGAFRDAEVGALLDLPSGESPLYIIPVGHAR